MLTQSFKSAGAIKDSYKLDIVIKININNDVYRYLLKYSLIFTSFFFIICLIMFNENFSVKAVKIENNSILNIMCGNIYTILNNNPFILYVNINEDKLNPIIKDL